MDDYFHGFTSHQAKKSIALTREFFDQRHEYLVETINAPQKHVQSTHPHYSNSPRDKYKSKKDKSRKKKKDKRSKKDKKKEKRREKQRKNGKSSSKRRDDTVSDEISRSSAYHKPLEFKEKGWKRHQRIATSASAALAAARIDPNNTECG